MHQAASIAIVSDALELKNTLKDLRLTAVANVAVTATSVRIDVDATLRVRGCGATMRAAQALPQSC